MIDNNIVFWGERNRSVRGVQYQITMLSDGWSILHQVIKKKTAKYLIHREVLFPTCSCAHSTGCLYLRYCVKQSQIIYFIQTNIYIFLQTTTTSRLCRSSTNNNFIQYNNTCMHACIHDLLSIIISMKNLKLP